MHVSRDMAKFFIPLFVRNLIETRDVRLFVKTIQTRKYNERSYEKLQAGYLFANNFTPTKYVQPWVWLRQWALLKSCNLRLCCIVST